MPRVSVLMSCFNKAEYLRETVPTVLSQTFGDFEVVIFDNQSTDDSMEILRQFDDPRIRLFQNSRNLGPVGSMNNCIEKATGEYVTFFHGDDLWEPNFLEKNLEHLERHASVNVCHSLMHTIDEKGARNRVRPLQGVPASRVVGHEEALKRLVKGCYLSTPTVVYRKSAMRFYDFRYTYVCDWDMYLQFAASGYDFLFINEPLMYYRVSEGSETSIGVRGGNLIVESYVMLRNFFAAHPALSGHSGKAFKRLSDATLRRTRTVDTRERALFLVRCALLSYPLQIVNPVFHFYLLIGFFFGPAGLRLLKRTKKRRG